MIPVCSLGSAKMIPFAEAFYNPQWSKPNAIPYLQNIMYPTASHWTLQSGFFVCVMQWRNVRDEESEDDSAKPLTRKRLKENI